MSYRHHIFVCLNHRDGERRSCAASGSEALRQLLREKMTASGQMDCRVNGAMCLGKCGMGPVAVSYPDGRWYTELDAEKIDEIVANTAKTQ